MQTSLSRNPTPQFPITNINIEEDFMSAVTIAKRKNPKVQMKHAVLSKRDNGVTPIGEPFYAVIKGIVHKAQLIEVEWASGCKSRMLELDNDPNVGKWTWCEEEKFMPIVERFKGTTDPVVALWQEFKQVSKSCSDAADIGKEHKQDYDRMCALEKEFQLTPAQTPKGLLLQIRHGHDEYPTDEFWETLLKTMEAGLNNLQPKASIPAPADPIIALWQAEQKAKQEWEAIEEDGSEEYERLEQIWSDASDKLWNTPAQSLEGLLLQVKDFESFHKDGQTYYGIIATGLENVMRKQAA